MQNAEWRRQRQWAWAYFVDGMTARTIGLGKGRTALNGRRDLSVRPTECRANEDSRPERSLKSLRNNFWVVPDHLVLAIS